MRTTLRSLRIACGTVVILCLVSRMFNAGIMALLLGLSLYPGVLILHVWVTACKISVPQVALPGLAKRIWISHGLLFLAFLCQYDARVHVYCPGFPILGLLELLGHRSFGHIDDIWLYLDIPSFIPVILSYVWILLWKRNQTQEAAGATVVANR